MVLRKRDEPDTQHASTSADVTARAERAQDQGTKLHVSPVLPRGFSPSINSAHERLDLAFGFQLWDGSTIPANLPQNALMIRMADEAMIAALLRKPNSDTLTNLWVSARPDILNGSIFDLAARRPAVRTKSLVRNLDRKDLFTTLLRFLFLSRGGPFPLEQVRGNKANKDGSEAANRENVHYHYDVSNDFYLNRPNWRARKSSGWGWKGVWESSCRITSKCGGSLMRFRPSACSNR